jgi:hypothetical protein
VSNLPVPDWLQAGSYSANMDRYLIEAIWPTGGTITGMTVGPRGAGANMSVDVAAGSAVVHGSDIANQASYLCRLLGTTNALIGAAPGAGLNRIDLVVAQVVDPAALGSGTAGWVLAVVPGTAAASPVPPAVPASALALAQVSVPTGTASILAANITDLRNPVPQLAKPTVVRGYQGFNLSAPADAATTLATLALPAITYPCRLIVRAFGVYGFSGGISVADFTISDGATLILVPATKQTLRFDTSGVWYGFSAYATATYARGAVPNIIAQGHPAGTNCWFQAALEWELVAT